MDNIKGIITRTFYYMHATACVMSGFDDETGMPTFEQVESEPFVSMNPNDTVTARRMLKRVNKHIMLETVRIHVDREELRAIEAQKFFDCSYIK